MKRTTLNFKQNRKNLLVDSKGNPIEQFSDHYGYRSAEEDRLNAGFTTRIFTPSALISLAARKLRARAQDLERDSDYTRRFLKLTEDNIIGWKGIRYQSEATRSERTDTADRQAIRLIEDTWKGWSDCDQTTIDRSCDMVDLLKMLVRRRFVDGEVFVELMPGAKNDYRFALRVHDADDIPLGFHDTERNIRFGIRYNKDGAAVSYFVNTRKSNILYGAAFSEDDLVEVPASRMCHYYVAERPGQRRGITGLCSTAERLYMLQKFEQATLVGAQIASSKMGFFRDPDDDSLDPISGTDSQGEGENEQMLIDVGAGEFQDIGHKMFESFDVDYPPARYEEYTKSLIREAASGLGISYHILANDPSSVNYSTAREFKLQDVEFFRTEQQRIIRKVLSPVADSWLKIQLLTPDFDRYQTGDYKRLKPRRWQTRGWDWVDPMKEAQGNKLQIEMGVKTPSMVCNDKGVDFEEVCEQFARDRQIAERFGLNFDAMIGREVAPEQPQEPEPQQDTDT